MNDVREIVKDQVWKDVEIGLYVKQEFRYQRDLEWQRFLVWSICEYWAWLLWKEQMLSVGKVVELVLKVFVGRGGNIWFRFYNEDRFVELEISYKGNERG